MDIPKIYLRDVKAREGDDYEFEVVDGQQRLRAIWGFFDGEYPLAKDGGLVLDGEDVGGRRYKHLSADTWIALGT